MSKQREIKFRAWDKRFKRMHYGKGALLLRINSKDFTEPMQYVGLEDKNGKEIYEGDVVEYKAYNTWHKDEVKFSNGKFHGQLSGVKDEFQSNYDMGLIETLGCEVIGNIYENPELLEGGKDAN